MMKRNDSCDENSIQYTFGEGPVMVILMRKPLKDVKEKNG